MNRTKGTKKHGILVDYYGVSNNLKEALNIWGAEDEEDIKELLAYFRDIDQEIPVLEARYNRMIQLFEDKGITDFRKFAEQKMTDKNIEFQLAEDCIELAASIPFRAQFDTYLKAFFDSLDLLFNSEIAHQYYIPAKRFGYLLVRIRNRYKDATLDLKWAKPKVRKMIDTYLETLGIDSRVAPVNLLSDEFMGELKKVSQNPKTKASEMEHAIRRHIKVNLDKDPVMYKRFLQTMEENLLRYQGNWEMIVDSLTGLRNQLDEGRKSSNQEKGLTEQELPFYDFIVYTAFNDVISDEDKEDLKALVRELISVLKDAINKPSFWKQRDSEIRKLEGSIDDLLDFSGIKNVEDIHNKLTLDLMKLAKRRHQELTGEL